MIERIFAANSVINVLKTGDKLFTSRYDSLQELIQVLQNMKEYIKEIAKYNTEQKFLEAKTIEQKFKNLQQRI